MPYLIYTFNIESNIIFMDFSVRISTGFYNKVSQVHI